MRELVIFFLLLLIIIIYFNNYVHTFVPHAVVLIDKLT